MGEVLVDLPQKHTILSYCIRGHVALPFTATENTWPEQQCLSTPNTVRQSEPYDQPIDLLDMEHALSHCTRYYASLHVARIRADGNLRDYQDGVWNISLWYSQLYQAYWWCMHRLVACFVPRRRTLLHT